jgi:hypothetical protein
MNSALHIADCRMFCRGCGYALTGLSLLPCISMASLCVRSHWVSEGFGWDHVDADLGVIHPCFSHYCILSAHGSLAFDRNNISDHPNGWELERDAHNQSGCVTYMSFVVEILDYSDHWQPHGATLRNLLKPIGIRFGHVVDGSLPVVDDVLILPDWLLIALLDLLPSWHLIRRKNPKLKREQMGLCINCGYDLRATPERCPECGTVPEKTKIAI